MLRLTPGALAILAISSNASVLPAKPIASVLQGISHCSDVVRNSSATEVKQERCWVEGNYTANHITNEGLELISVNGPYCDAGFPFDPIDAANLCNTIPNEFQLPPAFSNSICQCETWVFGNAAWAACNCDYCQTWTDTAMQGHCTAAKNACYGASYYETTYPPGFERLYKDGWDSSPPIYSSC